MNLLDRLDELDYRLHLRQRPDAPRRELTGRKVWFLRAVWCLLLLYASVTIAVAIAGGPSLTSIPALALAAIMWPLTTGRRAGRFCPGGRDAGSARRSRRTSPAYDLSPPPGQTAWARARQVDAAPLADTAGYTPLSFGAVDGATLPL